MGIILTTIISFITIMFFYYMCIKIYTWIVVYLNKIITNDYVYEYEKNYEYYKDYGDEEMTEENQKSNKCCKNACGCSVTPPKEFELYKDSADEFRWRLKSTNGRIIATSGEGYKNKADAEHAISIVKSASNATVVDDMTD